MAGPLVRLPPAGTGLPGPRSRPFVQPELGSVPQEPAPPCKHPAARPIRLESGDFPPYHGEHFRVGIHSQHFPAIDVCFKTQILRKISQDIEEMRKGVIILFRGLKPNNQCRDVNWHEVKGKRRMLSGKGQGWRFQNRDRSAAKWPRASRSAFQAANTLHMGVRRALT